MLNMADRFSPQYSSKGRNFQMRPLVEQIKQLMEIYEFEWRSFSLLGGFLAF